MDLRSRVIAHHEATGEGSILCARRFGVGEASVRRWFAQLKERETLAPKAAKGGKPPKIADSELPLVVQLAETGHTTMNDLCDRWFDRTGLRVSTSTMARTFVRATLTHKKTLIARRSAPGRTSSSDEKHSAPRSNRGSSRR